ncbi:MAG: AI-2E family transporter [Bacteroidota bacterium]
MKASSRYAAIALSLILLGAIIYFFSDIVAYILIAWVISMIGQPLMEFFQKRLRIGRFKAGPVVSAALTLLCFFVAFASLLGLFVPLVVEQARNLAEVDYGAIANTLEEPLNQFNDWAVKIGLVQPGESPEQQIQETLKGWFEPARIGNFFSSILNAAGSFLFTFFSVVFIAFFFLKEQGLFVKMMEAFAPPEYEESVHNAIEETSRLLTRYFGGVVLQMTIITIFVSVFLSLLGIKNALLIGFFAALINVIPYLGPIIGAAFGVFITISSNLDLEFYNEMLPLLLRVLVVFASMQMLDNFVLQPFIFSNSVLAHPLEIFIVILMGAQINGIVGMVLAIPVYTVLRVIARVFLSKFQVVQKLASGLKN